MNFLVKTWWRITHLSYQIQIVISREIKQLKLISGHQFWILKYYIFGESRLVKTHMSAKGNQDAHLPLNRWLSFPDGSIFKNVKKSTTQTCLTQVSGSILPFIPSSPIWEINTKMSPHCKCHVTSGRSQFSTTFCHH